MEQSGGKSGCSEDGDCPGSPVVGHVGEEDKSVSVACPKKGCGPWYDLGGTGVRRSQGQTSLLLSFKRVT